MGRHGRADPIDLALRLLAKEIRRRIDQHPAAHSLTTGCDSLDLRLRISTVPNDRWVDAATAEISKAIDSGLARLIRHHSVFQPGRVYCLRCASAECAHSVAERSTQVFAGYTPSGLPRFLDFGQWLLEQQDTRVDLIYRDPPRLIALFTDGEDLTGSLLPAFRDLDSGYHIHGQVAVGWYRFPSADGLIEPVALTFQVVSTRPPHERRRFGLNLLGRGPDEEPLEHLYDRIGEIPWQEAARWAQRILQDVERTHSRPQPPSDEQLDKRLRGLLTGLARRLEHNRRARDRKTRHGQQRHKENDRPTWKALADLDRAKDDCILFDTRRKTFVVLGERGRAHVFNSSGRLVTSLRCTPMSVGKRLKRSVWRTADRGEIDALRRSVAAHLEDTVRS